MSGPHPRGHARGGGARAAHCLVERGIRAPTRARTGRERRFRRALAVLVAPLCAVVLSTGCSLHQEGVRPPDNRIFFPGGAVIESAGPGLGKWLYVVNSNSDLRYNAGTVVAVNLPRVQQDYPTRLDAQGQAQDWSSCPADSRYVPPANVGPNDRCCWDTLDPNILNCDEQVYVQAKSSVRIGNFGARPVFQQLPATDPGSSGRRRLFVPVRGDASIGMIEVATSTDSASLSCTGPRTAPLDTEGQFPVCESQWQISRAHNSLNDPLADSDVLRLPDEPYAIAVDDQLQLMYVGHLRGGSVSLMDLGTGQESRTPELLQIFPNLLPTDASGSEGITSLTIRTAGCFGPIYAASRYTPLVGSFVVYGLDSCHGARDPQNPESARGVSIVGTGQFLGTGLGGAETRGIEFITTAQGKEADRAFILQRTPPAVVAVDNTTQLPFATLEVCLSPTNMAQQVDAAGKTVALFITCFDAGEVYVIDPWTPRVAAVIPVGRGPVATVLPPPQAAPADAGRAYVVGFGANNIAVIDINPNSQQQYRVIQRIGFSSPTPREVGAQ